LSSQSLRGCGTALATPFNKDGSLDEGALKEFVNWQIEEGIHFLVPCGSTGEAATMTLDEHTRVVRITVEQAKGRVPVVAGAASNDTAKAVALSKAMKELGATHLLHASPMYNKPPQRGIVAHFKAIAEATDLPIVVYNVPGRTGSNIEAKTTIELAGQKNIHAVKEA
jgi:4-hydroxy-tetrahydrodipicolinate synthase